MTSAGGVRAIVDEALTSFLRERERALPDAAELVAEIRRVVDAGGKRLRPAFCVWGYRAGGGSDDGAIARAAASLELVHTFAIIHDDVMDRSPLRRGEPASYKRLAASEGGERFGLSAAILVGDLAMALADDLWASAGFAPDRAAEAARIYHAMRAEVIGGQFLDLQAAARGSATPEETRRISVLKSGRYTVERPLEIGAVLAGAPAGVREALARFGAPLGEAFQLRDDVLGAFGDPSATGKDVDGDLREGKQTLLVALARKRADGEQRAILDRALGNAELTAEDAALARDVFRSTAALDEVLATIADLLARAEAALVPPLPADAVEALRGLARRAAIRID